MKTKLLWLPVSAAALAGAGLYLLKRKTLGSGSVDAKPQKQDSDGKGAGAMRADASVPAIAPENRLEASYSFISGFRNAVKVEVSFCYDGSRFSFAVLEDGFPVESDDSHVAVLSGEDFSAQFEYAAYYAGEDFDGLRTELAGKHTDLKEVFYGESRALLYRNGDHLCLDFVILNDPDSFLHVTLLKAKGNDDPLSALPDYPDVRAMLSSLSFSLG